MCSTHWRIIIFVAVGVSVLPASGQGPPFLNSLAVLFRARPPWPTMFPSAKMTPLPLPFVSSNSQQGILVAHPINPSSSTLGFDGDKVKLNKKPETIGEALDQAQGKPFGNQQPTLPALIPLFPPPVPLFPQQSNPSNSIGASQAKGIPPPPSQSPTLINLVPAPTSAMGTFSLPNSPTTAGQSHLGAILEAGKNMLSSRGHRKKTRPSHHHHHHQHHHHQQQQQHHHHHEAQQPHQKLKSRRPPSTWRPIPATQPPRAHESPQNGHSVSLNNLDHNFHESSRKQKKLQDFRPSPQLNSFVETTVITDYASHVSGNGYNNQGSPYSGDRGSHDDQTQSFQEPQTEPKFESGFRPITLNQYAPHFGTTSTRPHYTNSHQQYFNPWSLAFNPIDAVSQTRNGRNNSKDDSGKGEGSSQEENFELSVEESKGNDSREKPFRKDRKVIHGIRASSHIVTDDTTKAAAAASGEDEGQLDSGSHEGHTSHHHSDGQIYIGNRGKKKSSEESDGKSRHRFSAKGKKEVGGTPAATISSTTASSELVEEWIPPGIRIEKKSDGRKKYPTYNKQIRRTHTNGSNSNSTSRRDNKPAGLKGLMKLPDKCDKFNRFGFCPVTRQYPLDAAENIAYRCSALLSHLIAPLPKMDVQYDIGGTGKNGSGAGKGRATGWAWKSYLGKPVCDTDELTTVPGWARNENGDWMIILQTKTWQQKAHISLCSPAATNCEGLPCLNSASLAERRPGGSSEGGESKLTKCVQRFTAQRLAVFDPDNPDRCPVVRSVFLPSACVCLTSKGAGRPASSSAEMMEHNYTSYTAENFNNSGRQPLFSSSKENSGGEDRDEDVSARVYTVSSSFPVDSREALRVATASLEREKLGGRRSGPFYSTERRAAVARGSDKDAGSFFHSPSVSSNATFMIITEKFTTNESSKETTVVESGGEGGGRSNESVEAAKVNPQ